jgi:HemY protein
LELAQQAHGLAPDLVPAAAIAGRILASRGQTPKAAKIIQRTWKVSAHPDLATAYAFARVGDSPSDRLDRIQTLAKLTPMNNEGAIAVASTAIEAREWSTARAALLPLLDHRLTQRVCTLMARIESGETANTGKVREWLARAVNAPRDPAWTADGVVSNAWAPLSPVKGTLDAFEWRIPVEHTDQPEGAVLTAQIEELVALGAPMAAATPVSTPASQQSAGKPQPKGVVRPVSVIEDAVEVTRPATVRVSSTGSHTVPADVHITHAPPKPPTHVASTAAMAATSAAAQPKIFVPSRPPDDPGPDEEPLNPSNPADRFRSASAKG